jgi:hypothetical protein
MTARTARRVSQPDCAPEAPFRTKKQGQHAAITACAVSPAQRTAGSPLRGQNPKGRSVLDRTACTASFRASPRRVGVRVLQSAGVHSEVNRRYRD